MIGRKVATGLAFDISSVSVCVCVCVCVFAHMAGDAGLRDGALN